MTNNCCHYDSMLRYALPSLFPPQSHSVSETVILVPGTFRPGRWCTAVYHDPAVRSHLRCALCGLSTAFFDFGWSTAPGKEGVGGKGCANGSWLCTSLLLPGLLKELVPLALPPSCGPLPLPGTTPLAAAAQRSAAARMEPASPSRAWSSGPCSGGAVFPEPWL